MPDEPPLSYNRSPVSQQTFVKLREMDLEAGWLGKIFGGPTVSPLNISGLILCLFVLCGLVFTFWKGMTEALDYWKLTIPVVTLVLGYLFGKKQ